MDNHFSNPPKWQPTVAQKVAFEEWKQHFQMMLLVRGMDEGIDITKALSMRLLILLWFFSA